MYLGFTKGYRPDFKDYVSVEKCDWRKSSFQLTQFGSLAHLSMHSDICVIHRLTDFMDQQGGIGINQQLASSDLLLVGMKLYEFSTSRIENIFLVYPTTPFFWKTVTNTLNKLM